MSIIRSLLGRGSFVPKNKAIESIKSFNQFDSDKESLESADALLVFRSDIQQCWLVFTNERMYFVLDDAEQNSQQVLWARDKDKLEKKSHYIPHIKTERISDKTERVLFGDMNKGFMYTKSLFTNSSIDGEIIKLLNKHFYSDKNANYDQ